jgi:YggT family protein
MDQVLVNFITMLVYFLWFMFIARMILSFTNPMGGGGLVAFVYQITEPILAPVRRLVPPSGGLDWSPLIVTLLLGVVLRVISQF